MLLRHHPITLRQSEIEACIRDPVLAAWAIFNVELDTFQRVRLRYMWWVLELLDDSGISIGMTEIMWIWSRKACGNTAPRIGMTRRRSRVVGRAPCRCCRDATRRHPSSASRPHLELRGRFCWVNFHSGNASSMAATLACGMSDCIRCEGPRSKPVASGARSRMQAAVAARTSAGETLGRTAWVEMPP